MALIDELHERRKILSDSCDEMRASLRQTEAEIDDLTVAIWALEGTTEEEGRALQTEATAIAALTPAPDFEAEKATAREQLEREPEIEAAPADEQDDASEFAADDDAPAEHISILTGDPAIEPESGLHGEPTDLQGDTVQEMQQAFDDVFRAQEEAAALNSDMQDEREQPVEGYAHVTNPEADALARAHDYYSPEKIAERGKFNPFSIFRREDA